MAMGNLQYRRKGGIGMELNFVSNFANPLPTRATRLLVLNFLFRPEPIV